MDNSRRHGGHFKYYAYIWRPSFGQRQTLYRSEETKYVDILPWDNAILVGPPDSVIAQERTRVQGRFAAQRRLPTIEFINKFINNGCSNDQGRYFHRNTQIRTFLERADIDEMVVPTAKVSKAMALIDDRNNDTVFRNRLIGSCRPSKGPLTAHQLFLELSEERLPRDPTKIAAERRLIYITDLDPFCALALAITSSVSQAQFIRDLIERYLTFHASIGVDIYSPSPKGQAAFSLEFHLPYYAWRPMSSIRSDSRQRADGSPLRRSEESIPLHASRNGTNGSTDSDHEYIYEAQISVMVTGIDDWIWAAYCFTDVYFRGERHSDTVEHYSPPEVKPDPHTCGRYQADPPIWIPREYFLRVLACRMEQVKQEWSNSVSRLVQQTESYIYAFTREDTDVSKMDDVTQRKGFKWSTRVLRKFHHLLSKTINSWDRFNDGEIRYFCKPSSDELVEPSWITYLAAIDKDVTKLRDLCSELQHQTDLLENMTASLATHAQHAETITTRLQSEFIQALTVITIFYLPPTLASTIFSMQGVLPHTAGFRDWGFTLLGLFIATSILLLNLPRITTLGAVFRAWQDDLVIHLKGIVRNVLRRKGGQDVGSDDGVELEERDYDESSDTGEV